MGKDIFTVAQPASFQEISSYQARKVASNDFKNSRSILTKHDVSPIRFRWPIVPGIERWLLFSVRLRTPGLRIFNPPSSMEGVEGGRLHLFRLTHSTMTNLGFRNAWQKTVTVAAPFGCRSRLDRTSSHRIRGRGLLASTLPWTSLIVHIVQSSLKLWRFLTSVKLILTWKILLFLSLLN